MLKNRALIAVGIVGLVAVAAVAWWLGSPLFINRVVDESFPTAAAPAPTPLPPTLAPTGEVAAAPQEPVAEPTQAEAESAPVEEGVGDTSAMPEGAVALAQGEFMDADEFHQGSGTATIYELADGSHVLRFENFEVTNGPDLHVLLLQGEDMEGSLYISELKGNVGDQNYAIPADADVSLYSGAIVYCVAFHVPFSTATFS